MTSFISYEKGVIGFRELREGSSPAEKVRRNVSHMIVHYGRHGDHHHHHPQSSSKFY
jgi:hypothetical protein